ncbi:MAG: microcystin degradation protein MlrC [Anaerolineaceae bacterium]|nr:microcystin degradation protein MlrC [Anaerolineaceae bacterium]
MRIAIAKFGQETSTFSPVATTLDTFKLYGLYEGQQVLDKAKGVGAVGGFLDVAESSELDWTPVPLFGAWAGASGVITAETLKYFEDKLIAGLQAAKPVDAFFFDLHGAGQAENQPDTEGHLLAISREILGDDVPIIIALDHHANLTQMMVENANGLVAHRTQPHNPFDTGQQAARMLIAQLRGEIAPTMAWQKIPMITHQEQFLTSHGPMKEWFDLAREMETRPGVVSASTFPMQPWLDVPEGGWAAAVVTNNDPALARELAAELADKAWQLRDQFWVMDSVTPEVAIRRAVAAENGVVILSDTGDAVFGGATGDSTTILTEMLRQQITQPALLTLVDPEVVGIAINAGVGSEITVQLGGKLDHNFGQPVEITAEVVKIGGGRIEAVVIGLESFDLGRAVLLKAGSIQIVVCEARGIGGNHPIVYRHFGVEPAEAKMLVVKTASNWQYYRDMTSEVIRVNTPGATMSRLQDFDWQQLPRPIYPLDDLPQWSAR